MGDRLIQILAGTRRTGRCRFCRATVEWATTAPHGKMVPLDPHPLILSATCNEETTLKFLTISANSLHFATCTQKPPKPARRPRMFGGRARA